MDNPLSQNQDAASVSVSSYVPKAVGELITEDAATADRSESYIIRQILSAHYAARVKRKAKAEPQKKAA